MPARQPFPKQKKLDWGSLVAIPFANLRDGEALAALRVAARAVDVRNPARQASTSREAALPSTIVGATVHHKRRRPFWGAWINWRNKSVGSNIVGRIGWNSAACGPSFSARSFVCFCFLADDPGSSSRDGRLSNQRFLFKRMPNQGPQIVWLMDYFPHSPCFRLVALLHLK